MCLLASKVALLYLICQSCLVYHRGFFCAMCLLANFFCKDTRIFPQTNIIKAADAILFSFEDRLEKMCQGAPFIHTIFHPLQKSFQIVPIHIKMVSRPTPSTYTLEVWQTSLSIETNLQGCLKGFCAYNFYLLFSLPFMLDSRPSLPLRRLHEILKCLTRQMRSEFLAAALECHNSRIDLSTFLFIVFIKYQHRFHTY